MIWLTDLVELEPDCATHKLLAGVDGCLKGFPLRAEPEPIIHQLGIPAHMQRNGFRV